MNAMSSVLYILTHRKLAGFMVIYLRDIFPHNKTQGLEETNPMSNNENNYPKHFALFAFLAAICSSWAAYRIHILPVEEFALPILDAVINFEGRAPDLPGSSGSRRQWQGSH